METALHVPGKGKLISAGTIGAAVGFLLASLVVFSEQSSRQTFLVSPSAVGTHTAAAVSPQWAVGRQHPRASSLRASDSPHHFHVPAAPDRSAQEMSSHDGTANTPITPTSALSCLIVAAVALVAKLRPRRAPQVCGHPSAGSIPLEQDAAS